jgi:molybdate transport system regulatory protein
VHVLHHDVDVQAEHAVDRRAVGIHQVAADVAAGIGMEDVELGQINAEVIVDIGGGDSIAAVITNESVEHLALKEGAEVYAMVKAPWVIVTTSDGFKTSARNELHGTVVRCQEGAVNGEVVIELAGGKSVAAVVTNDSIKSLGLTEGVKACALIKASHVILAVNA